MAISNTTQYTLLIVILCVALALAILAAIYITVYWADSTETWHSLFPRILIAISITIAVFTPLLIPADITVFTLNPELTFMGIVWQVFTYLIMVLMFIILPFAYIYEDERLNERGCCKTFFCALLQIIIVLIVVIGIDAVLYFTMGQADLVFDRFVPLDPSNFSVTSPFMDSFDLAPNINFDSNHKGKSPEFSREHIYITMSFISYFIAFVCFFGCILFAVFFPIGLIAQPLDSINTFRRRPKTMSKQEFQQFKINFGKISSNMLNEIDLIYLSLIDEKDEKALKDADIKRMIRDNRTDEMFKNHKDLKRKYEKIKREAKLLHERYEAILLMNQKETANPIKFYLILVGGIFTLILTLLLFAQIISKTLYNFFPYLFTSVEVATFLSTGLKAVQDATNVPLISTLLFAIFSTYVIFVFIKGVTKFGFRFIMFIPVHPMKIRATPLATFIFNVILMMLGIIPTLQFLTQIFEGYSYGAAVDLLFNQTVRNMLYLKGLFDWYFIIIIVIGIISLIVLLSCPGKDVAERIEQMTGVDNLIKNEEIDKKMKKKHRDTKKIDMELKKQAGVME